MAIGALASIIMGVGGGAARENIVLSFYGHDPFVNAVSTASGVGVIVSIPGALGYVVAGWGQTLSAAGVRWVTSPGIAFALLTPVSLLTVPYGVALAHHLEKRHPRVRACDLLDFCQRRFRFYFAMAILTRSSVGRRRRSGSAPQRVVAALMPKSVRSSPNIFQCSPSKRCIWYCRMIR